MMAGQGAVADRIERGLIVGAWSVEIGIATPAPGESLSGAARRLAERVVAEVTGLPAAGVRVASLLPSGRPIVASDDGLLSLAVSVAHERRLVCAAVCAGAGIGIDVVDTSAAAAGAKVIATSKVPVGGGVVLEKKKLVVTQPRKGRFRVFSAVFSHEGCIVGGVSDKKITCPCHGSQFAIGNGAVVTGPAEDPLPSRAFTIEDGVIYLA